MKLGKTYFSGSITFDEGNNVIGPSSATFESITVSNTLNVTGNITGAATTASYVEFTDIANKPTLISSSNQLAGETVDGDLTVTGKLTAQEFHTEYVSGSIIYTSGSTKFGDSADDTHEFTGSLYQTSGNVGIGTSIPQAHIHEVSSIITNMILEETSAGYAANLALKNTTDTFTISSDANPAGLYITSNSDPNSLGEGLFFIKNTGNIGIGTNNPTANIHISSTGDATLKIEADTDNAGTENDNPSILLSQDGGAITATIALNGDANNAFTGATGNSFYINSTNNQIYAVANNPVLFLESTGNVGLNMSDPQYPLDLYYREETGTDTTLIRLTNDVVSDLSQQSSFIDFRFLDSNSNETPQVRIGAEVGQNADADSQQKEGSGAFVVYTNNADTISGEAGASLAERFRVDYTGNVGIGTTNPTVKLDVAGQIRSYASTGQIYSYSTDASNDAVVFAGWTAGTGIQMKYNPNSAVAYIENNYPVTAGQPFGDIHFRQNLGGTLTTRLMIKADGGNVGIGTTLPAYKLDVSGNIRVGGVGESLLFDTTGAGASNGIRTINDYETVIYNGRGAAGFAVIGNSNIRFGFGTSYTDAQSVMTMSTTGVVKITSNAAAHLILDGDNNNSGDTGETDSIIDFLHDNEQYGYRMSVQNYGGNQSFKISDNKLGVYTDVFVIGTAGNVGIGGTNTYSIGTAHLLQGASSTAGAGAVMVYNDTGTANCPGLTVAIRDESTDATARFIQFYASVGGATTQAMGGIVGNGATNVQFASLSDEREKENITEISGSLNKIMQLQVSEFDWVRTGEHINAGFIAQNVERVFPEYVIENISSEGEEPRKGITGGMSAGFIAHLTVAIQELKAENEALKARIQALEG